jgi:mycofactocin precursor
MPYYCDLDHSCRDPVKGKVQTVEPNQQLEAEAGAAAAAASGSELVTETLVEEVSIDGMCGVY